MLPLFVIETQATACSRSVSYSPNEQSAHDFHSNAKKKTKTKHTTTESVTNLLHEYAWYRSPAKKKYDTKTATTKNNNNEEKKTAATPNEFEVMMSSLIENHHVI